MLLGKQLVDVFQPDVLILFDSGAGEMIKAALAMRILSVGLVPNKTHKDMLMPILREYVEAMNLVNWREGYPPKPMAMIKFEADHPDNDDVKRSVSCTGTAAITPSVVIPAPATTPSVLATADAASPKTKPPLPAGAQAAAQSPATPKVKAPIISTVASSSTPTASQPSLSPTKSLISFGTTIL